MLPMQILAYKISLRWSSCCWATFRNYKHSAPPELWSLIAAMMGWCVRSFILRSLRLLWLLRREIFFIDLIDHL
jgi:hypothetical protein